MEKNNYTTKKYLPMAIKDKIAEDIANAYFIYDISGELADYSEVEKMKAYVYRIIENYSDIDIPKVVQNDGESDMDFLMRAVDNEIAFVDNVLENGVFESVLTSIPRQEIKLINYAIDSKIEFKKKKIEDDNSFGKSLTRLLYAFLEKAPDTKQMQEIFNNLKDMDISKLSDINELRKVIG
jgi:hypothetical protein